jgi:hypothetical protein
MIDLNKYYVAKTYDGVSGSYAGRPGFVPQATTGDNKNFLRGDGTWADPTISTIQYIENQNNVTLDIKNYDTFLIKAADSLTVFYANFAIGKNINVYLIADHQGHVAHTFPSNTVFAELGDENIIYSFEGYTTRILLQNIGDNVINFSSVSVTPPSNYFYNYNNQGVVGIGINLIDELLEIL